MNISLEQEINELEHSLLVMDIIRVKEILTSVYEELSTIDMVEKLVVPALERLGVGWENGEVSLAQVYMSGRICEETVDLILPPSDPKRTDQPPMAIVVLDDYHMLGKRIVYSALRASGFEMRNYNHMDIDTLVDQIKKDKIQLLLISVLMLPSALHIKELRKRLVAENIDIKIIVGGAPFRFDPDLWHEVGADAMGKTAMDAVTLVKKYVEVLS